MGYRIEGHTETEEVQGGTKIVKVWEFHCFATPSETYFQFRRPKGPKTAPANVAAIAEQLSTRIEQVLALSNVTDVVYSQDVTPGGKLVDMMTTYYRTEDGAIQGSVESDLAHFGPTFTGNQVSAEIAIGGDFLLSG